MQVVQPCLSQTPGFADDNEGIGEVMQKNVDLLQAFLKSLLMVLTSRSRSKTCLASQKCGLTNVCVYLPMNTLP